MPAAGTIESVVLDGTSFNAAADADLTVNQPTEKELIATSGPAMPKITKKIASVDSVTLVCDGTDAALLDDLHDRTDSHSMSYTEASGDTYIATGLINIVSKTTQENRIEINMLPTQGGRFTQVLATG